MAIAVRTLSSLEKVFPDEELTAEETASLAALRGERVSFQIACRALDEERVVLPGPCAVRPVCAGGAL